MIKKLKVLLLSTVVSVVAWGCAKNENISTEKETYKISLILDEGGVNDQSFNQSSWEGALSAKEKYNVEVNYIESKSESEYLSNVETAIDQDSDLIIGVGFKLTDTIEEAAKAYPQQRFAIIDGTYEEIPSNVQSILFNEEEAGYCVGLIASKMTESNVLGFSSFNAFSNPILNPVTLGISMPPINPTVLLSVILEAIKPTAYPASCSLNNID